MVRHALSARALVGLLGEWRDDGTVYLALAARVRLLLIDGRLASDVRLPAERELAAALHLSRTTVAAAYRELRDDGFASTLTGSGTTTALPGGAGGATPVGGNGVVDLTKASLPATRLLPEVLDLAVADLRGALGSTGYETYGALELRRRIADRYTARGLPTSPEEVLVTSGAQSAISLAARVLIDRGDRVHAESPSYPNAFDALRLAGARLVTSPVTVEHGWDLETLESVFRRAAPTLSYVLPERHNPTGRTMTATDRECLIDAAAAAGTILLDDETTADLHIDSSAPGLPLAAGGGAQVVHIGSASKLFWGGLRIGWVRAKPHLIRRMASARAMTDLAAPVFEQFVVAHLLDRVDDVIEERRGELRARRDALAGAMAEHLPGWQFPQPLDGGIAAWVNLVEPVSSQLALAARARGLLVTAGPRFGVDGAFETCLRLPITAEPEVLRQAVQILADCWGRLDDRSSHVEEDLPTVA